MLEMIAKCIAAGVGLAIMLFSCGAALIAISAILAGIAKVYAKGREGYSRKHEKQMREKVRKNMRVLKDE